MKAKNLLSSYGFKYDRVLRETLTLPYQLSSITIPQNELMYYGTINEVFEKLQFNLMYLYSLTKISDNNIPYNYNKIAGGSPSSLSALSGRFSYFPTISVISNQLRPLSTYNLTLLDNLKSGEFYPENTLYNNKIGFFCTDTHVIALTSNYDNNTIGVFLSTNTITETSKFNFQKINSIIFDKNNFIYVCDENLNTIYKYDISNLIIEDNLIGKKIIFVDSVGGGDGTLLDKTKFNKPSWLNLYNNILYVMDKGNYAIKMFDTNLNWKKTLRFKRVFESFDITAFKINTNNNLFYIGFNDKFGIFTSTLSSLQVVSLSSQLVSGEKIVDFSFSKEDTNIFYVVTNKNIQKRTISKPNNLIGKFLLTDNNIYVDEFRFSSLERFGNDDLLTVYGKYNNAGIFYSFLENSNYTTILTNNDLDLYTIDEIKIHPEEYASDWVFSKANSKILINILSLRDRIVRRFAGKYDSKGNLLYFGQLYLQDPEINREQFDYSVNYLVNLNEVFSNSVFNRSIESLFSFQTHMLSVLKDTTINIWPPLSTTVVIS